MRPQARPAAARVFPLADAAAYRGTGEVSGTRGAERQVGERAGSENGDFP